MKAEKKGYVLVLTAGILWGTIGLFATLLSGLGMDAASAAFFRLLSSAAVLALLLLIRGRGTALFRISRRGLLSCALIGLVSQAVYNYCYMNAIRQNGMAAAAVFLYTSPVYVALLSRLFFREPLRLNKLLAILINIAGCILTVTGGTLSPMSVSPFGLATGLLSGFAYALLPVLSRTGADREDPFTAAFYGQLFGAVFLFPLVRPDQGTGAAFSLQLLLVLAGFGLIPSALAYIAYYGGMRRLTETSVIPVLASVETVVAAGIGLLAFRQELGPAKIMGIALVLCSIAVMNLRPPRSASGAEGDADTEGKASGS